MLSSITLEKFRSILEKEQQDIEKVIHTAEASFYSSENESTGELSGYDNHPADMGTELFDREKDAAISVDMHQQLEDIHHAIQAMDNGTYGQCAVCHHDIPVERLEAVPATLYCKNHSPHQEVPNDPPQERSLLGGGFEKFSAQDDVGYDGEDSIQDAMMVGSSDSPADFLANEDISNYSDTYINSEENVGYVEDFENFLGTDIFGQNVQVYGVKEYQHYEEMIDDYDEQAIAGTLFTDDYPE